MNTSSLISSTIGSVLIAGISGKLSGSSSPSLGRFCRLSFKILCQITKRNIKLFY